MAKKDQEESRFLNEKLKNISLLLGNQKQPICLHLNELPLRHVCNNFIGRTDGPKGRQGVIGSILPKCETIDVVDTPMPFIELKTLSRDQFYLY